MLYESTFDFRVILRNINQNYSLRILFFGVRFWNCYELENGYDIGRNILPF
jgi:hypothetical protein